MKIVQDDLQERWRILEDRLAERFGKKPDLDAILFLIGIQETGMVTANIPREQKQDLMHVAVCTILSLGGYFITDHYDEDKWPHFTQLKALPDMPLTEQENFLKDHILFYFEQQGF